MSLLLTLSLIFMAHIAVMFVYATQHKIAAVWNQEQPYYTPYPEATPAVQTTFPPNPYAPVRGFLKRQTLGAGSCHQHPPPIQFRKTVSILQ